MFKFPWVKQREQIAFLQAKAVAEQDLVHRLNHEVQRLQEELATVHLRNRLLAVDAKRYAAIRQGFAEQQGDVFAVVNIDRGDSAVRGDNLDAVTDDMIQAYRL